MKIIKIIFIISILILPIIVNASVGLNTEVTNWETEAYPNAETLCYNAENDNDDEQLANATQGYYLQCIKISCTNNINNHSIKNLITSKISCTNGNNNPFTSVVSTGAEDPELQEGATCEESGTYAYATEIIRYDCSKVADGSDDGADYVASSTDTTTKVSATTKATTSTKSTDSNNSSSASSSSTSTNDNNISEPPETGIEDYFILLSIVSIILLSTLIILDKKNIFKKI